MTFTSSEWRSTRLSYRKELAWPYQTWRIKVSSHQYIHPLGGVWNQVGSNHRPVPLQGTTLPLSYGSKLSAINDDYCRMFAGMTGIEPVTWRLTVSRSTVWATFPLFTNACCSRPVNTCRVSGTRTHNLCLPKTAIYQLIYYPDENKKAP